MKYLKNKYRVSQQAVSGAYRILQEQRYVHRVGRQYWVGRFAHAARPSNTALIVSRDATLFNRQELAPAWCAMERELTKHSFRCHSITSAAYAKGDYASNDSRVYAFADLATNDVTRMLDHVRKLTQGSVGKPLFLLVGQGIPDQVRLPRNVNYLCLGTLDKGITRELSAYILENRFGGVALFHDSRHGPTALFRKIIRIVAELRQAESPIPIEVHITPPDGCTTFEQFLATDASYNDHGFGYLQSLMSKFKPTSIEDFAAMCILSGEGLRFRESLHAPLWIFTHDTTAIDAVDWCKSKRKRVPQDVSILSMHNGPDAYTAGLSSCVPDYHTIGYLMAHALIGDLRLTRSNRGYMHTPVNVIHRMTTP